MLLLGLESMRRGPTFSVSLGELFYFRPHLCRTSILTSMYHQDLTTIQTPISRRYFWPANDRVRDWLKPNWDAWVTAPPQWFTARFVKRVISAAPPEVLPLTVLRELAEKHSKGGQGGAGHKQLESDSGSEHDDFRPETDPVSATDADSVGQGNSSNKQQSHRFENTSREELVRMEAERRANKAFARAKQLWIWAAALAFSYVDLVTTVVVGMQYLDMGTAQGTRAAHVTFAMLGVSVGLQAVVAQVTGTYGVSQRPNALLNYSKKSIVDMSY